MMHQEPAGPASTGDLVGGSVHCAGELVASAANTLMLRTVAAETDPQPMMLEESSHTSPFVLLVEDNPGDVRLVREALAHARVAPRLATAHDGLQALRLLRSTARKPDLILLDLNLPGMDGRTLLERIKTDPELLRIPVVVVSGSDSNWDVSGAYCLHANCYVVKPVGLNEFLTIIKSIDNFWLTVVRLPKTAGVLA